MVGKQKQEWLELCECAANEPNAAKLMEIVAEINGLSEAKKKLLKERHADMLIGNDVNG
jgi:hypothetical protein